MTKPSARGQRPRGLHRPGRDGEKFYQAVFESSPDGILIIDPDTQRPVLFNDAACRQLGYSRDEFAALAIADYDAAMPPGAIRARVAAVLHSGSTEFETVQRTQSGELRNVRVWVRTITRDDRPVLYTVFRDITDGVRATEAFRQSAELLERSQRVAHVGHWLADLRSGDGRRTAILLLDAPSRGWDAV